MKEYVLITMALIWLHFIGDFILQSDNVAINKSKSDWVLSKHVFYYMLPFLVLTEFTVSFAIWYVLNYVSHWSTDYVTSRLTSHLYQNNQRHWFFVTIGADQTIHLCFLIASYFKFVGV